MASEDEVKSAGMSLAASAIKAATDFLDGKAAFEFETTHAPSSTADKPSFLRRFRFKRDPA